MKIIVSPNSFRGSISALEAALAIEEGLVKALPNADIRCYPIADGGDCTLDIIMSVLGGKIETVNVLNPLGKQIKADFGILEDNTAVIELAKASGIAMLDKSELNPLIATTFGTGQLIRAALDRGCRKIIVGLGGSATVDGGAGLLQALGAKLLDSELHEIGFGGIHLAYLEMIDISEMDDRLRECEIIVACDTEIPLLGENGASYTFAHQKGATPEQIKILEKNLKRFANVGTKSLGINWSGFKHSGAAGGTAGVMSAILNAQLRSGIDFILDLINFEHHIADADLVITAEGRIDNQTLKGKGTFGVAKRAKKMHIPVIALAGQVPTDTKEFGMFDAMFSIVNQPLNLFESVAQTKQLLTFSAEQLAKTIAVLKK